MTRNSGVDEASSRLYTLGKFSSDDERDKGIVGVGEVSWGGGGGGRQLKSRDELFVKSFVRS